MTTSDVDRAYAERRDRDWQTFASGTAPLVDYWARWEEISSNWTFPVEFMQPFGIDVPDRLEPLRPLLDTLGELEEVDVPPLEWLHATYLRLGFLRLDDISWTQVESYYQWAAPRIRRVEPFSVHLKGVSVADDERIYLGVDDGGHYREVRHQIGLGIPEVGSRMRHDPWITPEGDDRFMPTLDVGFFTGAGDRRRVVEVLESYRGIDLGEVPLTHMKLARVPIQPFNHYIEFAAYFEVPMLGTPQRGTGQRRGALN